MVCIKNCEEAEIVINSLALSQFPFGNEFILRGSKIRGIEVFSANDISKTPSGSNVISQANLAKAYLVLVGVENNRQIIKYMPLNSLRAAANNGTIREFDMPMLNPSACYVQFGDISTLNLNDVIPFAFYWE